MASIPKCRWTFAPRHGHFWKTWDKAVIGQYRPARCFSVFFWRVSRVQDRLLCCLLSSGGGTGWERQSSNDGRHEKILLKWTIWIREQWRWWSIQQEPLRLCSSKWCGLGWCTFWILQRFLKVLCGYSQYHPPPQLKALWRMNQELLRAVPDEVGNLMDEMRKTKLELSLTEEGKEGKTQLIASNKYLEKYWRFAKMI